MDDATIILELNCVLCGAAAVLLLVLTKCVHKATLAGVRVTSVHADPAFSDAIATVHPITAFLLGAWRPCSKAGDCCANRRVMLNMTMMLLVMRGSKAITSSIRMTSSQTNLAPLESIVPEAHPDAKSNTTLQPVVSRLLP
jgi:hypothetical protein